MVFEQITQNFEGFFCASWTKFQGLHNQIKNRDTLNFNLIGAFGQHWKRELATRPAVRENRGWAPNGCSGMEAENCPSQPVGLKGSLNKSSLIGSQRCETFVSAVFTWKENSPSSWGTGPPSEAPVMSQC